MELSGKTLGIVGMGRIGQALATRAKAFNMNIVYHSRTEKNIAGTKLLPLNELLKTSDVVSLHTPLTTETRHLIGEAQLNMMKKSAFLINTTRGAVVDEKALYESLKSKRIAGAGLDVYEEEPLLYPRLVELDNTVLLPHIGSATVETRTQMALLAAENAIAIIQGKKTTCHCKPSRSQLNDFILIFGIIILISALIILTIKLMDKLIIQCFEFLFNVCRF